MIVTSEWAPGPLLDASGLLGTRVGAWNHCTPDSSPAAGEHTAKAITAGHGAVKAIDEIIAGLHGLRERLVTELRADEDARAARIDALLAGRRTPAATTPAKGTRP